MGQSDDPYVDASGAEIAKAVATGFACGLVLVLAPYAAVWILGSGGPPSPFTVVSGFNGSLTLLFPVVQGFALGLAMGRVRRRESVVASAIAFVAVTDILAAATVLREGVICLIIMSPLLFVAVGAGALLGRGLARVIGRGAQASLAPLIVLAVVAEALGPQPVHSNIVVDEVVVNAPAEYVWRYVVSYPENTASPEYWLWRAGLPQPDQSVATEAAVGATRLCRFSGGYAFEERITELTPNEVMTFDVTRQPDHPEITGHFQFDRGQVRLQRNPDGTTTIIATSWYRLFVRPAAYFDLWTRDITRQVHFRVLNHMKALAERDYREESSGGG